MATILGVIGVAQRYVLEHPEAMITGARYEELRKELVEAFGLVSGKGSRIWPPTRQTLMSRFGGWNESLERLGLATSSRGRAKGLLKFTEAEYRSAVADFVRDMDESGEPTTFRRYAEWCAPQSAAGSPRPSDAAVRDFFGTWASALRTATATAH